MREPFEIVDPIESFTEARESVSAGVETSTPGRTISYQALLAGAAIVAISTLILVNTLSPRMFAPEVDDQLASDTAAQHHVLSRQPGSDLPVSQLSHRGLNLTCNRPGSFCSSELRKKGQQAENSLL